MCTRIDHMENLQGRSFADDILPGYQSEEELEALEEQRQKEQRKSFWSSLFGKKEKVALHLQKKLQWERSMSKIKLIASDLDGTLLLNFAKTAIRNYFRL